MASFPERPMIGLLLRLLSQHYQQEMEDVPAVGGFDDIGPSAANVFPFVSPDGATISELAELAHVRKQTMAQAVDQLERTGYVERRPNPRDKRSQLIYLTARGTHRARGHPRGGRSGGGALGRPVRRRRARGA